MSAVEFRAWPKTPRLFRDCLITEKIDGTNAAVIVEQSRPSESQENWLAGMHVGGVFHRVGAQSRKRVITPDDDNFGFARWVAVNARGLAETLGPGYHYGEWWGSGIQRGYGLTGGDKRFSLFNVNRYGDLDLTGVPSLGVVPVLRTGRFDTATVSATLAELVASGSAAAPGFMRPEGVVVFHTAAGCVFKVTTENDDAPKAAA